MNIYEAVENRRSYYNIDKNKKVSNEKIIEIVNHSMKHSPASFNQQSARCIILFDEHHDLLWEIVRSELNKIISADKSKATNDKIESFKNGNGTVLFYEDTTVITAMQNKFAAYKDNFPIWSMQSNGMLQYIIWTCLEVEGLGVSLQHYNPIIDSEVAKNWNVPQDWKLIAQMPFGNPTAAPASKQFPPLDEYVIIKK